MSRKSRNLDAKKKKIIYCEGESEEAYFNMLGRKYSSSNVEIVCFKKGELSCIKDAITHIEKNKKTEFEKYIAIDADKMSNVCIDQCYKLCRDNDITILFSNVCFEVWILSHYIKLNIDQECTKDWLYSMLESKMDIESYPRFKGNDYDPYIWDDIQQACLNIEKLNEEYREQGGGGNLKYHNPFTSISGKVLKSIFDTNVL